jgi:hypothetical protein
MKKIVSGIMLVLLLTSIGTLLFDVQQVKAASAVTMSVVFSNGLSTIGEFAGCNFTVSFNIITYDTPGIWEYSLDIHWDPNVLELRDNNPDIDVVEGPWMKSFGDTLFFDGNNNYMDLAAGNLTAIGCEFYGSATVATGYGTMFYVYFKAKAPSATPSSISITELNNEDDGSYLLDVNLEPVTINAVVDGAVLVTKAGDLGGMANGVPTFGVFDGSCGPDDIPLFIQCYRGTAPAQWAYLGDLGSLVNGVPTFFQFDGSCGADDVALFILCYRGQGP